MLAAITLDLFAVLLGRATTSACVCEDILHVGPAGWDGFRPRRGGRAVQGAAARAPASLARAGRTLLIAVAGFGMVTNISACRDRSRCRCNCSSSWAASTTSAS